MHGLRFLRIALVVLAIQVLATPLFAESFETRHARDLSDNPPDLHFRLDTKDRQHTFRIGERVPLTLAFSSDSPQKYKLNGATYDRGGRLPTEEFVSDRADAADPYQDYFGTGILGGPMGGLRAYPILEMTPYEIDVNLNDWFRFEVPGRYRVYLKSHRLTRERMPGESGERTVQFAAVSNSLEIQITDDPAWKVSKLAEIRALLNQPETAHPRDGRPPVANDPLRARIAQARQELRYMGTPAAVQLAFEHARQTGESPDTLLLVAARDRPQMLAELDSYLGDPQIGFNEWDIKVRALFTLLQKDEPKPLLLSPWTMLDESELRQLRTAMEARQKRFQEILREEAIRLIPFAAAKDAGARQISGKAIASVAPEAARVAGLVPPDDYGLSKEELIAQFADFPPERQSELLGSKWDMVRGPAMIPALVGVINKAEPRPMPREAMALKLWGIDAGLAESAVRRLAELSPQEAARLVRSDIASGSPRLAGFATREFPAQDIPAADSALSTLLRTNLLGALPLVAKFATARLAHQIEERYRGESWPCASEESFVTYFVRTFPAEDGGGRDVLRRAMANREKRGCYRTLLTAVAAVVWNAAIEAQAIATLDDPDPEAAMSAARVLAEHADARVAPLLWKRLERWSERWRGRAAELEVHPITGDIPNAESRLGPALFEAIASARSWVLDESRRSRLVALCVDDRCRQQWSRERSSGAIRVDVSGGGVMYSPAFRVGRYTSATLEELKSKLLQFPEGSLFRWCTQTANPFDALSSGQREEMFQELAGFLSRRTMSIEPYSEENCMSAIAKQ